MEEMGLPRFELSDLEQVIYSSCLHCMVVIACIASVSQQMVTEVHLWLIINPHDEQIQHDSNLYFYVVKVRLDPKLETIFHR